jgi:hypothetical protein
MRDVLTQLKQRPTFEEQWPDHYQQGLSRGKQRIIKLEQIRNQKITMSEILANRRQVKEWWDAIT